jgi:hypothetical protein
MPGLLAIPFGVALLGMGCFSLPPLPPRPILFRPYPAKSGNKSFPAGRANPALPAHNRFTLNSLTPKLSSFGAFSPGASSVPSRHLAIFAFPTTNGEPTTEN